MNWISVEDKLPRHMEDVIVYSKSRGVWFGFYEPDIYDEGEDIWFCLRDDGRYNDVTHWMPLPEPPVEDFADDYIMPKKADHRKQRGRTAPNMTLTSPYEFVYCDECHYNSDKCPDDMRCENTLTQLFDRGCYHGRENKEE